MSLNKKDLRDAIAQGREAGLKHARKLPRDVKVALLALDSALQASLRALDEQAKKEKARRNRIQWVYCGEQTMVAQYKGYTYRYSGPHQRVDLDTTAGWVQISKATSIESASRKVRAWRKKQ